MSVLLPYAVAAGNGDDIQTSDQYQEMKFRVFEVTLANIWSACRRLPATPSSTPHC